MTLNNFKHKIKKHIPPIFNNTWFKIYVISIIVFSILIRIEFHKYSVEILLFLLFIIQLIHNIYVKYYSFIDKIYWCLLGNIMLLLLTNIFIKNNQPYFALTTLLLMPVLILTILSINYIQNLFKMNQNAKLWKKITYLILSYLGITINIIVFFCIIFVFFNIITNADIVDSNNNSIFDPNNPDFNSSNGYFYSATVYYSIVFGDMMPVGYSRIITLIECFFSSAIHIILLGLVISTIKNNNKNDIIFK